MKLLKVGICTPMWKRHDVFKLYIKAVNDLSHPDCEIIPCISGSEGGVSAGLVSQIKNSRYIEVPNYPLAAKTNAALSLCKDCDFVLNIGSDDLIHNDTFAKLVELMKQGYDFIGMSDFYFYDIRTKKALYWGGYLEPYRAGATCGAGRVLSRKFLEHHDWHIWEQRDSGRLDTSMQIKIDNWEGLSCIFSLKEHGLMAVDVKSDTNMTPFKQWYNSQFIDKRIITNKFNYL